MKTYKSPCGKCKLQDKECDSVSCKKWKEYKKMLEKNRKE